MSSVDKMKICHQSYVYPCWWKIFERIYSLCCTPGWDKFKIFRNSDYILFSSKDREETHKIMIWLSIFIDIHSFYLCNRYKEIFLWLILNLGYWPSNFICPGEKNLLNRVDSSFILRNIWNLSTNLFKSYSWLLFGLLFRLRAKARTKLLSHFQLSS